MENTLENKIIDIIRASGPMTFERYMEIALYDPALGYYMSEQLEIGRAGDFYTGAHLHPAFGEMIGRQAEEVWEFLGRPEGFTFVEIGGGTGHISKDMLDCLMDREIYDSLRHVIVEINPSMILKQRDLLSSHARKVSWVSSLDDLSDVRGCVFSNELLDAFPVHVIEMGDELGELYVNISENRLIEETGPVSSPALAEYFREFNISLEKGYRTEVNLRARQWLHDIGRILSEGFLITIDYGYTARDYYSEDRDRGTLMCYFRHEANEKPLQSPGRQDITSHVNFSAVKKWGEDLGLKTIGFSSQGAYLVSMGIDSVIQKAAKTSSDYLSELGRIKKLIMPQGMGDSHMVMVQYKGSGHPSLRGFSMRNQLRRL
ncbi:MAG: SAM-dependent methyltransferase [Nitrospirae bacterium]|nr:SAM-dependent methyltransferase [Nitrospirota bacterium]